MFVYNPLNSSDWSTDLSWYICKKLKYKMINPYIKPHYSILTKLCLMWDISIIFSIVALFNISPSENIYLAYVECSSCKNQRPSWTLKRLPTRKWRIKSAFIVFLLFTVYLEFMPHMHWTHFGCTDKHLWSHSLLVLLQHPKPLLSVWWATAIKLRKFYTNNNPPCCAVLMLPLRTCDSWCISSASIMSNGNTGSKSINNSKIQSTKSKSIKLLLHFKFLNEI